MKSWLNAYDFEHDEKKHVLCRSVCVSVFEQHSTTRPCPFFHGNCHHLLLSITSTLKLTILFMARFGRVSSLLSTAVAMLLFMGVLHLSNNTINASDLCWL